MLTPAKPSHYKVPKDDLFPRGSVMHFRRFFRGTTGIKLYSSRRHNSAKIAPQIAKTAAQPSPGEQMIVATNPFIL
jgi:hypothetical protein